MSELPHSNEQADIGALVHHVKVGLEGGAGLGDELHDIAARYGEDIADQVEMSLDDEDEEVR